MRGWTFVPFVKYIPRDRKASTPKIEVGVFKMFPDELSNNIFKASNLKHANTGL